ncbi:hypothetical protein JUJ52_14065 [Virgibacillus sp. AGTR]|uniref:hypothetical protein n=1 Tax=unclassified Virgibacillus TaxID=2620237 RepID=UPI000EF551CB|nr:MULTISPECIES: hypothetical protein [unclassified Virgibacillus]MCC2251082.1 hypothetical protein [Virgibacillus sp. AGTR]MDY7044558.1 hypothetical protein [Virgibacillus sp. M23]QRZ20301.1 hypothetical protein JUJ52_09925 [Virgibacillus sp. AGTR]
MIKDLVFTDMGEIIIKLLLGQLVIIAVVWTGMAFFFSEMAEPSKVIFYLVTSWMLLLIVIIIKTWLKNRKS